MDSYFESNLDNVMRWEFVDQIEDLASVLGYSTEGSSHASHHPQETVHCLQRDYFSLYGSHPKMDDRIYSTCGICEQVFNPQSVASHKEHCAGKSKIPTQHIKKKVKTKKKVQSSSLPLPPLFNKESPGPPVLPKFSDITPSSSKISQDVYPYPESVSTSLIHSKIKTPEPISGSSVVSSPSPPPPPLPILDPPVLDEASTSSRHRSKSKKNSKTIREYDPDVHCGVVEGQKGPCTRSITCSNHKIQLRKSVSGRSKNIHVLIAEKKASKEKETRHRSPPNLISLETKPSTEFIFPIEPEIVTCQIEEAAAVEESDFIAPDIPATITLDNLGGNNELHDEVEIEDPSNQLESGYCTIETSLSTKSPPVLYFNPISPIFVVTPVQFIQKENTVFVETHQKAHSPPTNGYFLTMPEPSSNLKLYKSHPKPAILPNFGGRKVGGAILSSNQRLEYQRNDIQKAINTKRMATPSSSCKSTYSVPPQRSILQKTKAINKVNCKRSPTEKCSVSESKQIKLSSDVNGFILHTEVNDVNDASQTNHCIQENINLLNMK